MILEIFIYICKTILNNRKNMKKFLVVNYKYIYHIFGNILFYFILWLILLKNMSYGNMLLTSLLVLPISYYVNEDALESSGLNKIFSKIKNTYY